jgi:CheY-like chemotaxis protein
MNRPESAAPRNILLVEDNPGDVRLTREAMKESGLPSQIHAVSNGGEALAYLRGEGPHRDRTVPDLVLLDLNLPGRHGRDVLAEMKSDPALRRIPVVVLTTSNAEEDIQSSYDLHANCFITKPVDFHRFGDVIKTIEEFWLSVAELPRG